MSARIPPVSPAGVLRVLRAVGPAAAARAVDLAPGVRMVRGREAIERFWHSELGPEATASRLEAAGAGTREVGRYWLWFEPGGDGYVLVHSRR